MCFIVTTQRNITSILGSYGYDAQDRDQPWLQFLQHLAGDMHTAYFRNLQRALTTHSKLKPSRPSRTVPQIPAFVISTLVIRIPTDDLDLDAAVILCNMTDKYSFKSSTTLALIEITNVISTIISGSAFESGFAECPAPLQPNIEGLDGSRPASRLLLETSIKRRSLNTRNGVSFLTARKWRTAIKKYQVLALQILKTAPPPDFVSIAAVEISTIVTDLHGAAKFSHVVGMPCGHSRHDRCLSILLAEAIAAKLKIDCLSAFESAPRAGSSHPRQSRNLQPFTWRQKPSGAVLLVDDLVSSGKHIEMAARQLREAVDDVTAIAWIGG